MEEFSEGQVMAGRYRVVRRLGKGGMGSVYEAQELTTGSKVALKVLSSELVEDTSFVERFRREAEATARLAHPNIVRVTDFVQRRGEPALIVMERLRGEPLLARVRRGPLSPKTALSITTQLTAALGAAHRAGVVHRDLKPANVFLVPLAHGGVLAKLLDFGIAKLKESDGYHRLTQTGVLIGTPRYASPEQVMGRKDVDTRSDVFSLGVLLYGMLAGRPPFLGKGAALLLAIREASPPPLESLAEVPPQLVAVVNKAMAKHPADRYQTMEELDLALAPMSALVRASIAPEPTIAEPNRTVVDRRPPPSYPPPSPAPAAQPPTRAFERPAGNPPVRRSPPTRGTPQQPMPRVVRSSQPSVPPAHHYAGQVRPSTPHARVSRPSGPDGSPPGRVSRPSAPDGTVAGLRGADSRSHAPPALLIFGGLLVAVAVLGLAFVGAGFWFQARQDGEAGGARDETHAPGGWSPRVAYLPSEAAQELGARCVDWEYQECACQADRPGDTGRCAAALALLREAVASGTSPGCRERVAARPECASLAASSGSLSPATPEWDAWANLRAMQLGPSCSTLLQRTCACGGDREPCYGLQTDLLASPGNDEVRRRLLARCRRVPDFDPRPCP